jgi:putative CocE/NonD family hydrolase
MSTTPSRMVVDRDVWIPMRDGVRLQADVYRPDDQQRHPVLLQRTPYDRRDSFAVVVNAGIEPLRAVERGYVVVIQDTRGRFGSEGDFQPFAHEADDGADTIGWLAEQNHSNGRVGMYGASYYAATQLLAATRRPEALQAIAPKATAADYFDSWFYHGGALQLGFTVYWALGLAAAAAARRAAAGEDTSAQLAELERWLNDPARAFGSRPLLARGAVNALLPAYEAWLTHDRDDAFWRAISVSDRWSAIDIPALHIGGWYDLFLRGTIANYLGMAQHAPGQELLVGPWAHAVEYDALGEVEFGPGASAAALDMTGVHLEFFDRHLADHPAAGARPVAKVFAMGANAWVSHSSWPPAEAQRRSLWLSGSDGDGRGRLCDRRPAGEQPSSDFTFDPADPVPTIGGATFLPGAYIGLHAGPRDQRPAHHRQDVLTFTGPALDAPLTIAGSVTVELYAATSAPDTDFTAKLVDVGPDGRALLVCDGIVRRRHATRTASERSAAPGGAERYDIDLGHTYYVLAPGHRVQVDVSSSNFPRFDVNPNHGGDIARAREADYVVARQRVFHDAAHASRLRVDVLP